MMNLIRTLADPGPAHATGALDLTLSEASARSLLFQKRDGVFLLALWLPTSLWDQSRPYGQKQVEDPADKPCTITFASAPKRVSAISGFDTTLQERALSAGTAVTITANERLTILRIEP